MAQSGIEMVKVRATVTIGGQNVSTPFVLSFNVNKARGQVGTCSAKVKMTGTSVGSIGSSSATSEGESVLPCIRIKAGKDGALNTIFAGVIKSLTIAPCWDDPYYVVVDVTGEDWLSLLQGKKYTRRVLADTAAWISIDGVARKGLRDGRFKAKMAGKIEVIHADLLNESTLINTTPISDLSKLSVSNAPEQRSPLAGAGVCRIVSD